MVAQNVKLWPWASTQAPRVGASPDPLPKPPNLSLSERCLGWKAHPAMDPGSSPRTLSAGCLRHQPAAPPVRAGGPERPSGTAAAAPRHPVQLGAPPTIPRAAHRPR